ncbi:putative U3 small nucleolar RNA-associated protein 11 [Wickerhamomyces ciferrii]|uniref:U3 small nucleolar RNA-associated protein 11 n=1 Tax=Wickerhamomyces ciferrii (strain ATCC 14091 / BCRC 22168 / CBS 111 / JCM 3599 / NBRC 0793 / NRRL Y-1031 F-60-10) TaxID=1206466 RepID=K0KWS5_WICCF|nr:putative U3 small nucleolar RNA-associated protein 11 [Wickerhamomyces ciferrii]CCH45563.1 putative U3 small nucleolar RNA-associated protein 11 [Wickerhamomyces ciferrii]
MPKLVHNVQKKQHRERSQPGDRKKFGLLEKKKDYQLRAKDYHRKQNTLKALKQKALQRNPDEYYHAMTSKKTDDRGLLISERDNEVLTADQVKLLKTQDSTYIKNLRNEELKKIEKLEKSLNFKSNGKHTVFVEDEIAKEEFDPVKFFQTDKNLLQNRENRLKLNQLQTDKSLVDRLDEEFMPKEALDKKRIKKYAALQAHLQRQEELKEVEERMDIQREGMKKGDKKKVIDANGRRTYKFKKERKR